VWYASEGDLWLMPYDGGPARRTEAAHWDAEGPVRPSPDGATIAYGCSAGVCHQDRSGGSRRTIDGAAQRVAWSPDGARLAAVAWEGRQDVVLTIAARDGRVEHRVSIAPDGVAGSPKWTPDGERLFVQTSPLSGRRIVMVDANTGAVLDLSEPRWVLGG
jgi:Tol biopolymer transport system component